MRLQDTPSTTENTTEYDDNYRGAGHGQWRTSASPTPMSMPEGDELMSQLVREVEMETTPEHAVLACKQNNSC